ncbi:TetR family transcriptional regulator [Tumebacillus algifaecis]|uniref:TetR family transcriptional regulator n=1 Tax=Tumebacillus algifaecis TaxID=1214604 RepID=A0A223D5U7_9BACL|nr:TetR/AcrR family transcriptional regulator [Tumebacillus algifaecis]ASS76744.1 TetR family transcriptional regulator [Tumebacillus algifaecis]
MARERKFTTDQLFQEVKQLLLQHKYEGFHFGLLAERLEVSRGTLYKYYENKEELISDFMIYEMELMLGEIKLIENHTGFTAQFDYLMQVIFRHSMIHQILGMIHQLPVSSNPKVIANKKKMDESHLSLYQLLQRFIDLGRQEKILKDDLPDGLLLGIIFQTINLPNHFGIAQDEWLRSIKEILRHGMFTK